MDSSMPALRMSILVGEDDIWQGKPVHHEIVVRARRAGLAGATVLRGCEGYGATTLVHTDRLLSLAEGLPVMVVVVDAEDRVRAFLPELDDLVADGTVVLDRVEVVRYAGERRT